MKALRERKILQIAHEAIGQLFLKLLKINVKFNKKNNADSFAMLNKCLTFIAPAHPPTF